MLYINLLLACFGPLYSHLIYEAVTIGLHYNDRIDELDILERTHNVVGPDWRRI